MKLYHATPRRNLGSIMIRGLLCSKSRGKRPAVWLAAMAKAPWAVLHVIKRHAVRAESVVILEVEVPRSWLRRSRKRLWFCSRDLPASRFRRVIGFDELAGVSLDDGNSGQQHSLNAAG